MKSEIINNSNVVINTPPLLPTKQKKHFKKMWKFGGWRLYLTHNFRLKNTSKREGDYRNYKEIYRAKSALWEKHKHHCQVCGKKIDRFCHSQVHHILAWWRFPQFEADERNLLLCCNDCHKSIHKDPFTEIKLITEKAKELDINLKDYYNV